MPGQQCAIQCAVEQRHLTASGCGRQIALHLFEFASVLAQGLLWCEHAPAPDGLVSCVVTIVPTRSMDPDSSFILFVRAQFSAHGRMTRVVVPAAERIWCRAASGKLILYCGHGHRSCCFINAASPLRLHHRRDRCCCSCPRCSYHHVRCCCRAKLTQDPSQYCATETSEVVRHLATCLFLCSGFMICVAMVLRCAARHGGAQQIGIIVRGVWWSGSICQVCFGHDGFSTDGAFTRLEDSSNISAATIIIVRTWWRKLRPGSVDQICN